MRPFVVLRYRLEHVWTRPASARSAPPPHLENSSPVDAYDIAISSLAVDEDLRYHFARVPSLHPHETLPLDACMRPAEPSLAAAISRDVVEHVLVGRAPVTRWRVRISYRDEEGRPYATCCEIRVVRLPLEIEAAVIPCPEPAPTGDRRPVQSPAPLVEARC